MDFNPILAYKAILKKQEFGKISKFVNENFGIKLPEHKQIMIQGRLIKRLVALKMDNFEEYTKYVFSEEGKILELPHMIDVISTNKTEFFRESIHFDFLKNNVITDFLNNSKSNTMKIWSAACSSGEEVYTLAMVINEELSKYIGYDFSILGTDISNRMLEKAKNAIYPLSFSLPIPLDIKKKYLLKSKDSKKKEVRITKDLRVKTSFLWHNLIDEDYNFTGSFDVIFCRNVLIYFSKDDQMQVIKNLSKKLNPGGYIFLGHSESIAHFNLPLKNVSQTVFQKL